MEAWLIRRAAVVRSRSSCRCSPLVHHKDEPFKAPAVEFYASKALLLPQCSGSAYRMKEL